MMIDMHAHWRPQALAEAMRKRTTPPMIVKMQNGEEALDNGKQRIPIDGMFDDMDARLRSMDRYGISTAVLSLFGQLQWIERLPVAESLPLCRAHNDALAALCEKHPGRFAGYASLPLQNMEVAAMEFARALSLTGIVGAVLPGNAFLSLKNATEYEPIMEIADQYKAMIFIHWGPRPGDQWPRVPTDIEGMNVRNGTVDMQSSLSSDMVTLCWTDYLDRFPNATVHIHNLGGNFPFEIERMDHRRYMDTPDLPLPSSRVKKPNLYVDCNSFGPRAIEMGVELYGAEKIMFATDGTDFSTEWSKKAIADARLTETQRREILYDNAARLLGKLTQLAPPMEMRAAAE